jgi:sRNA-binding regulator protein Hfq
MSVKYQIFVSSTFEDLKEERNLVIKAILEMGHIPVGMEMFSAGDEEQWKLIQKQIDDCDYYVVILAHKYGSMDGNISYSEKEYDYATSKNIPTLGFIIDINTDWPINKSESESDKTKRLNDFKSKVKHKLVSFWTNKEDLYGKVSISLMKQFATNPREGWVKAGKLTGPEVISELTRLSKENSELRNKILELISNTEQEEDNKFDKIINTLKRNTISLSFFYINGKDWEDKIETKYFDIFKIIAPELMVENTTKELTHYLGIMLKVDKNRVVRTEWPIPSNYIKKILADLSVLEIIQPSSKKHSIKDSEEYWTLSESGKKTYKLIRRELLEYSDLIIEEEIKKETKNKE